jgi:hypothetical protein
MTNQRRQKKLAHSDKFLNYSKLPCVPTFNHYSQRRVLVAGLTQARETFDCHGF